jgi:uncharacterized SAM-binding protein YcdF (DUF218 family)
MRLGWIAISSALVLVAIVIFGNRILVTNDEQPCDAVLVLAGETTLRIQHGIDLVRSGAGKHLFVDVSNGREYGIPEVELANRFLSSQLSAEEFTICKFSADSTIFEAKWVRKCLAQYPQYHSVLLVTNDYHSRRALMTFREFIPDRQFHISAVTDKRVYQPQWWRGREHLKYFVESMAKMFWYLGVERWLLRS